MPNATEFRTDDHLAVVIPTYRAAAHIADVIRGVPAFVRTIVVVDDASPDDSAARVAAVADPRVVLVRHEQNQGVGGAMRTGYEVAFDHGADVAIKMDADDQMHPDYLPALLQPLLDGEADYTKGNRFIHVTELAGMPWLRRLGNVALSFLTKVSSGYWNVFDPTNGYTALHRSAYRHLHKDALARGYFFESSMLIELGLTGAVVRDVDIPARYGIESSSLSESRLLWSFPPRLLRGLLRRVWIQHFVRDFSLCSVFGVTGLGLLGFGLAFGLFHWIRNVSVLDQSTPIGTVMLAVLPIILGVQMLLQAIVLDVQLQPQRPLQESDPVGARLGATLPRPAPRTDTKAS